MTQWVKNPTAAAQVTAAVQVQLPAWHKGLKDPVLPWLQCRLQLWLKFSPWPRKLHMLQVQTFKKKKKNTNSVDHYLVAHQPLSFHSYPFITQVRELRL